MEIKRRVAGEAVGTIAVVTNRTATRVQGYLIQPAPASNTPFDVKHDGTRFAMGGNGRGWWYFSDAVQEHAKPQPKAPEPEPVYEVHMLHRVWTASCNKM